MPLAILIHWGAAVPPNPPEHGHAASFSMSFIIAAPASGSGKTTVTLGILRALAQDGQPVRAAKSGPDYIDPQFHAAACGRECVNLDAWAMAPERLCRLASGNGPLIIEGAMGLFDGAPPDGKGATADLARILKLPVILVIDAARMAQSVAPLVAGFARFDQDVSIAGVILNKIGSARHTDLLRHALAPLGIPVIGAIPRSDNLSQPSRHLGLVQADERPDLETFLDSAATLVRETIDLSALPLHDLRSGASGPRVDAPAQTIAIARDTAFAFAYPHMMNDWQASGASITTFSPLNNDPVPDADLVFLPGGYPELHAGTLAAATTFMGTLRTHRGQIYGECGGYMTLGKALTDAEGHTHQMAGLLPLATSFATRKLHLGYRMLTATTGPFVGTWAAHEFHYATTQSATGMPLFKASDAAGTTLPDMGLTTGRIHGSFAHLIDRR